MKEKLLKKLSELNYNYDNIIDLCLSLKNNKEELHLNLNSKTLDNILINLEINNININKVEKSINLFIKCDDFYYTIITNVLKEKAYIIVFDTKYDIKMLNCINIKTFKQLFIYNKDKINYEEINCYNHLINMTNKLCLFCLNNEKLLNFV